MNLTHRQPTNEQLADARLLWAYHQTGHKLRRCDAAIGLGSHDLGVASFAAKLFHRGLFPVLIFSGANSPTTATRFPRGEAVEYRLHAIELGVPDTAILVESEASNTSENIELSRLALDKYGLTAESVMLISKPYMQRRAYATCRQVWPEVEAICASEPLAFDEYLRSIGSAERVLDMLVGDLQRVIEYPKHGFAIEQDVPVDVLRAYDRLIRGGFTGRLMKT